MSYADIHKDFATLSCSSTVGVCYCGGEIDYGKRIWKVRKVFEIGRYIIQRKERQLYQCKRCLRYD